MDIGVEVENVVEEEQLLNPQLNVINVIIGTFAI